MKAVLKIALGVFLGLVMVGILAEIYVNHQAKIAIEAINREVQSFSNSMLAIGDRERVRQVAIERERTKQKQLELEYKRQQVADAQVKEEERRRMEAAWSRYYQKPARCERPKPADLVECGNDHIRARRKFDEQWARMNQTNP